MTRYLRRFCRSRDGSSHSAKLMIALTMMLMLGNLVSPMMSTVTAETVAAKAAAIDAQNAENVAPVDTIAEQRQDPTPTPTMNLIVVDPGIRISQETPTTEPTGDETEEETEAVTEETEQIPASMIVNLAWCPNGTDLDNETDGHNLDPLCTESGPAVTVVLTSQSGNGQVYDTASTFPGSVLFNPLGFDDWTLSFNTVQIESSALFCEGYHSHGNTKPYQRYALASLQTNIDTLEDEDITCYWYGELPVTASIQLTKWNCPEGFDFATQGYGVAVNTCWDDVNPNVDFTVKTQGDINNLNDDFEGTQTTDPNNNDSTTFAAVPAGLTEISEAVPLNYALVAVFCGVDNNLAQSITLTSANAFQISTDPGTQIKCDVFDTLGAEPAFQPEDSEDSFSLTIYKWECPEGIDTSSTDPSYFSGECATQMADVPFHITDGNTSVDTTSDIDGRQIDNLVPDSNGNITITEDIPSGYTTPVVFCAALNADQQTQYTVDSGNVVVPAPVDDDLHCSWYNVHESGYGNVHVYKWECTTEPVVDADFDWYSTNCTTPQNHVTFVLEGPNGPIQTDTGDNGTDGYAQMDGVESGSYPLTETVPDGYVLGAVFCATTDPDATPGSDDYSQYDPANGSITADVVTNETTRCDFFNVLNETGISITIYKWQCPEGIDTTSMDPSYYSGECATEQAGVPFHITDANGTQDTTSDTNGRQIDNLVPDSSAFISITEDVPDGYGKPVVFCQYVGDDSAQVIPVDNSSVTLSVPFLSAQIQCFWYNIPVTDFSLTIYKWECPEGIDTTSTDPSYFSGECATQMADVPFHITDGNTTVDTTSDIDGRQIDNLVPDSSGNITITEDIPSGYTTPVVFCAALNADQETQYTVTSGSVTVPAPVDDDLHCSWYNVPSSGYGDVYVYKWGCPEDAQPTADITWLSTNCTTPRNGVTFVLDTPSVDIQTNTGDRGAGWEGIAAMEGVETGTYPLSETYDPDGYILVAVYCATTDSGSGVSVGDLMPVTLNGNSIDAHVQDGKALYCYWYNAPTTENTVHVTKWECPEGYDATGKSISDLQNDCMTRVQNVDFSLATTAGTTSQTTDIDGETKFVAVPTGMITLSESIPTGYSPYPIVVCGGTVYFDGAIGDFFPSFVSAPGGQWTFDMSGGQWTIHCDFYNIPQTPSTVEIYKWQCPEGVEPQPNAQWYEDNCTTYMDGVDFTLTDIVGPRTLTTSGGIVTFNDVATGPIQIAETIPSGYSNQPFIVCQFTYPDGSMTGKYSPTPVNGVYNTTIDVPGSYFRCDWYNVPVGPGEITVYKWTCPEGYDRTAWGANPMVDCTQATNGITFRLIQNPPDVLSQSDTGDSIPGAVYFGGLEPDSYILNEILTPDQSANLKEAFIWQCYGLTTSSVQPYPLNVGQIFQFNIVGDDHIVCHWFNVPKTTYGSMTVSKFNCTTEKYVADVYCYTNQTGQEFNLQKWDGSNWNTIASGKTDVNGKLSFPNLDEGDYRLVEPNTQACLMKSSYITPNNNIGVKKGEDTTVYVYNCKTPPPDTKTPTKYPNTGVDPSSTGEQRLPGVELAGLFALAGISLSRRRFLKRAAGVTLGTGAIVLPAVAAQELQPLDSTPTPATPGANIFGCGTPTAGTAEADMIGPDDSTPESTPFVDQCTLGAIPIHFRVPIIGVDAEVEYLEIIDGQMQPPTGAEKVTWYKETTRLGQIGNGIYAGHLNYWGIPEGVFFRLESLKEGDIIEIDGDDAITYIYEVQWSQNFPSDEEPPEEALGTTQEKAITVITCGGEWVSARAEYDHRTLVRAVLLEDNA